MQNTLKNTLWQILESKNLTNNLTRQQSDNFTTDLLTNLTTSQNQTLNDFVSNFIKSFIENVNVESNIDLGQVLPQTFNDTLNELLSGLNTNEASQEQQPLFKLLDLLIDTNVLQNNSEFIKQLIKNVLDNFDNLNLSSAVVSLLGLNKIPELNSIISQQEIKDLVVSLITNQNTKQIVNSLVERLLNNLSEFKGLNNVNQLIQKLLTVLDFESLKQPIKNLINDLLDPELNNNVIKSLLLSWMNRNNIGTSDLVRTNFINSLLAEIKYLLNELELIDPIINKIGEIIETAKTAQLPLVELSKIGSKISEVFAQKLDNNQLGFIKKILGRDFVQQNSDLIKQIILKVIDNLNQDNNLKPLIKKILVSIFDSETISKYVDKAEIENLINLVIPSNYFDRILNQLVEILFNNPSWFNDLDNLENFINHLITNNDFKDLLINNVKPVVLELLSDLRLEKTLVKATKAIYTNNNLTFNNEYERALETVYSQLLSNVSKSSVVHNLINNLFDYFNSNNLTVSSLKSELPSKILEWLNLSNFDFVKQVFRLELTPDARDGFKSFILDLVNQLKANNKWNEIFESLNISIDWAQLGFEKADFVSLVNAIINSSEFNTILDSVLSLLLDNNELVKSSDSYTDLIKKILKNQQFLQSIKQPLKTTFNNLKQNNVVKTVLLKLVQKFVIANADYAWIFENTTNKEALLSDLFDLLISSDNEFNLFDIAFSALEEFADDGNYTELTDILAILSKKFVAKFSGDSLEPTVVKLIKLLSANFINKHKTDLKTMANNVYNKLATDSTFLTNLYQTVLPSELQSKIQSYAPQGDVVYLIQFLLKNQAFNNIFTDQLNSIFDSLDHLENVNNFNDLIQIVIKALNFDSIQQNLATVLDSIIADSRSVNAIENLIVKLLQQNLGAYYNDLTPNFINNVITGLIPLLKELELYPQIIELTTNKLKEAKTNNSDLLAKLKELPEAILNLVKTKFEASPQGLVDKILNSPIYSNNKEYIKFLINKLLKTQLNSPTVINLITQAIDGSNAEVFNTYLDKQALKSLLTAIIQDQNLLPILTSAIDYVIDNDSLRNFFNDPETAIFAILKGSNIVKNNNYQISSLLSNILNQSSLDNLLAKALNKTLKDNELIEVEFSNQFYQELRKTALAIVNLDQNESLITKALNLLDKSVQASNNLQGLTSHFVNNLASLFNLSDYKLVKTLLNSKIFTVENEKIQKLAKKAIEKYLTTDVITKLIQNNLPSNDIANAINLQPQDVTNAVVELATSTEARQIVDAIVTNLITNASNYASANSYNDLVKLVASDQNLVNTISPLLSKLLKDAISKSNIVNFAKNAIKQFLTNPSYSKFFQGISNTDSLAENIVNLYNIFDKHFSVTDTLVSTVLNYLKTSGIELDINAIFNSLGNALKAKAGDGQQLETKVVALFKELIQSPLFTSNKNDILQIIKNVFETLSPEQLVNEILDKLPNDFKDQLGQFVNLDDVKAFGAYLLGNSNFKAIFVETIKQALNRLNEFNNVNSYADIVKKLFEILDLNNLKTSTKALVNDLLTHQSTKNLIKSLINKTLSKYNVSTNETSIQNTINALADNLKPIVDSIGLVDPLIDTLFNGLIEASQKTNDQELINCLKQISTEFSKVLADVVTNKPKDFIKKIINIDFIQQNKQGLIELLSQLYSGLRQSSDFNTVLNLIANFAPQTNDIYQYVSREHLVNLIKYVLKQQPTDAIVKTIISYFINNNQWVENIDNPTELINQFVLNSGILTNNKNDIKALVENILNSQEFADVVVDLSSYYLQQNNLNINSVNRTKLTKDLLANLVPYLKATNLYDQLIDSVINSITETNSITNFVPKFVEKLNGLINFNDYNLIKKAFEHLHAFPDNKETVLKLIASFVDSVKTNDTFITKLVEFSKLESTLSPYSITKQEITDTFKAVLNDDASKNLIIKLFDLVLTNWQEFKQPNSLEELITLLFKNSAQENSWTAELKTLVSNLLKNDLFKTIASKIVHKVLVDNNLNQLLNGITDPQEFLKWLTVFADSLNENFNFVDFAIDILVNSIKANGINLNVANLLTSVKDKFIELTKASDFQNKLLNVIRDNVNYIASSDQKQNVLTFIANISKYVLDQTNVGNLIYDGISGSALTYVNKFFKSKEKFSEFINSIASHDNIKKIIDPFFNYFLNNPGRLNNANDIASLLRVYLNVNSNKNDLKNALKEILINALKSENGKEVALNVVDSLIEFLEISKTDKINKFIELFKNEFANVLDRVGIIDTLITNLLNTLSQSNDINQFISNIGSSILSGLNLSDYNMVKKLLVDPAVTGNKDIINNAFLDMVNAVLGQSNKIQNIINELNVSNILFGDKIDKNTVNQALITALRNDKLKELLSIVLTDLIDRGEVYNTKTSYLSALNEIFKSPKTEQIKTLIHGWVSDVLTQTNDNITRGFASILINSFKEIGINLNENQDLQLFTDIIKGLFKTIANSPELTEVINNIYANLKAIDFESVANPSQAAKNAIVEGILSIISANKGKSISLSKLLNKRDFINKLINNIGGNNFINFLTRLFDSSDHVNLTGIYAQLDPLLNFKNKPQSSSGIKIDFDVNIFDLISEFKQFIASIYEPLFDAMIKNAHDLNRRYDFNNYKNNPEYKAIFRLSTIFLWILKEQSGVSSFLFWNGTTLEVENTFLDGTEIAFQRAIAKNQNAWNYFNRTQKKALGATGNNSYYNYEWITGNRSNSTSNSNYWQDQLLAYIYYRTSNPADRYVRGKTKTDALVLALHNGFMKR
ncbi:hypothetical protein [Mycoplasma nasistruthionis]|uniref:Uncharacterized protein n=1 Tax=Mycoplasma nasistruthionis TaxID=353852 RepID=A0A5B7XUR4_9MOLU|nr:hypothetical protein [Mycoplasma nasistruthionis]QCZ36432.1 hypothetical protein FG904_00095 [Mycoplasma nasistruthionis]